MAYKDEPLRKISKARNGGYPMAVLPSIEDEEARRPRSPVSRAVAVLGLRKKTP